MSHGRVEVVERDEILRPTPLDPDGVKAMVRIEELRLERTKIKAIAAVGSVAIIGWCATCFATCWPAT